jgi:uncharacterized protein (TIGR02246 family)
MKNNNFFLPATLAVALLTIGCNSPATDTSANAAAETTEQVVTKPDMAAIKTEIQALETAWAAADNARDAKALVAFYADDAASLSNNAPMIVGKAALQKDIEANFAKKAKGSTSVYEVMDIFGDENAVTEVGKSTVKDASGKVISTGKYMAIWEKRDGKYLCVRDIYNDDVKAK